MAEHARLKRIYAAAVDRLFAIGYQVTDAKHQQMKSSAEEARAQWEICGLKLEDHKLGLHSKVQSTSG